MIKLWIQDHNSIMGDLSKEFEITKTFEEADKIVLWNDVNPVERGIINYARRLGKKVIVMQHGRKGTSKYYPPFNEKIQADKLLVWGEFDRKSLLQAGQPADKIAVVGSTVFSHLKGRVPHEGINVVFCPEHWDREVEENEKVKKELRKLKGVKITTKIIESHDPKKYDNPIQSNRDLPTHLSICAEVLSTADLVVGISESTFELLAQSLDIPVVIMEEWEPKYFGRDTRYLTYRRIISKASKRATVKTLCETIKSQLKNPEELREERKEVAISEGGINLNALDEIRKAIITV